MLCTVSRFPPIYLQRTCLPIHLEIAFLPIYICKGLFGLCELRGLHELSLVALTCSDHVVEIWSECCGNVG